MRIPVCLSIFLFSNLLAQDTQSAQFDMNMQKLQALQACISKIDFNTLSSIEQETLQVKQEIEAMCKEGKRDQADKEAKLFYDKVMKLPAIIQIRACTQGIIPELDIRQGVHVCDAEHIDLGIPDTGRINW